MAGVLDCFPGRAGASQGVRGERGTEPPLAALWRAAPALGPDPRFDRTLAGQIKASNRHIELFGFMPEITIRQERRRSNLDLYDYKRTVAEIGVVRSF